MLLHLSFLLWMISHAQHFRFTHCKHFKIPPSHLLSPPPPPQFVIRLPRGPLLDFYSKRSWGASSTLQKPHTCASVTCGDSAIYCSHQPLAFTSAPLRHHCSVSSSLTHLRSSPFFWPVWKQDFHSFCFQLWHRSLDLQRLIRTGDDNQPTCILYFSFIFGLSQWTSLNTQLTFIWTFLTMSLWVWFYTCF